MQTLLSNLNVIRATRLSGVVGNGIAGMKMSAAVLAERIAATVWGAIAACHEERRELFWQPLYASAGSSAACIGSEKHWRFSLELDRTCPTRSRLWGQAPMLRFARLAVSSTPQLAKSTNNGFDPAG